MSDFYLSTPFPQAVSRSAHLPDLAYSVPEELRALLEEATAGRARLDECWEAESSFGRPTPDPAHDKLKAATREAEQAAASKFEAAQLWAGGNADVWAGHLHVEYERALGRIRAAADELASAYARAVDCARLLPEVKARPLSLTTPHGGPPPGIAVRLSPAVARLRELTTGSPLPGITE